VRDKQRHVLEVVLDRFGSDGTVVHAGDGLSDFGVRFPAGALVAVMEVLLEIPEHHYLLADDRSWFCAFSFEGDAVLIDLTGTG
jgi:hypothetical protein